MRDTKRIYSNCSFSSSFFCHRLMKKAIARHVWVMITDRWGITMIYFGSLRWLFVSSRNHIKEGFTLFFPLYYRGLREWALKIKHMFLQVCGSRGPQRIVLGYGGGQGGSGLEREILQSGYRQRQSGREREGGSTGLLLYLQEKSWGNVLACMRASAN